MFTTITVLLLGTVAVAAAAYFVVQEVRSSTKLRDWERLPIAVSCGAAAALLSIGFLSLQPAIDATRAERILTLKGQPWRGDMTYQLGQFTLVGSGKDGTFSAAYVPIRVDGTLQSLPIMDSSTLFWRHINKDRWTSDLSNALKLEIARIDEEKALAETAKSAEERRKQEAISAAIEAARRSWPAVAGATTSTN